MDLHYFCQDSSRLYIQYGLPSIRYGADEEEEKKKNIVKLPSKCVFFFSEHKWQ